MQPFSKFLVSVINHYHINGLHLFWNSFEWFCLQISHHHHHVTLSARIFLTLSRHLFLSAIAPGMSSGLHPVSSQSCCMFARAGPPAFARQCEGVHRSTSLMSSSLLLQTWTTLKPKIQISSDGKYFSLGSKALWSRINSWYSILF